MYGLSRSNDPNIRAFHPGRLRRIDLLLIAVAALLAIAGVVVLYSANRSVSAATPHYVKQSFFFFAGLGVALFIACFDHRFVVSLGPFLYAVFNVLLVLTLIMGYEAKGGRRWLDLGPVAVQPSEYTKLAVILMLAWYFGRIGNHIQRVHYFLLAFGIIALPGVLIFQQPDLGTALTLGPIAICMLYAAGCKRSHLAILFGAGLLLLPVAWSQLKDYQRERVLTIIDPSADPQGSGYHTIQSMITVGSGGMNGKGFLNGTQTYLSYLPEHHTDFIFSLLAEEFGFVGSTVVIALFLALLLRGVAIGAGAGDRTGGLLAVGIVTLLAFHIVVNIAITVGLLPVTGIPLPFLSYGGSFYLSTMTAIGLLLCIRTRPSVFQGASRTPDLIALRQRNV